MPTMPSISDKQRAALFVLLAKNPPDVLGATVLGLLVGAVGDDLERVWRCLVDAGLIDPDDPDLHLPS